MTIVILDGDRIADVTALHDAFAEALDLPAWYGANLDALHDALTERTEEIGVIVVNPDALKAHLGQRFQGLCRLLRDVQRERDGLHVCFDPFGQTTPEDGR